MLVACGLATALTGISMTVTYDLPSYDGPTYGALGSTRLVVGSAMTAALVLGAAAIRRRDHRAHGAWMTRADALGTGAGTQVFTLIPWALAGRAADMTEAERALGMGAGWLINVAVAEWAIRRRAAGRPRPRSAGADVARPAPAS